MLRPLRDKSKFRRFLYLFIFVIGLFTVLGTSFGELTFVHARLFGKETVGHATRYYVDNLGSSQVDYAYKVNGRVYKQTQELNTAASTKKPATFNVWYDPSDPVDFPFVSVRTYLDMLFVGAVFFVGIYLMYLPWFQSGVEAAIQAGNAKYAMKGCICGVTPVMQIVVNDYKRRWGHLAPYFWGVLIAMILYMQIAGGGLSLSGNDKNKLVFVGVIFLFGAIRYGAAFFQAKFARPRHSLLCAIRQAWVRTEYSA